ncbi:uncharacterized protein LOC126736524 isoform X2 [Anthonomus grandis grandis]|uniref:uncharacterized protein LOC126736524 isoform X2 n=1 Tax=Anthonomus grandis grandis TaxID=2921223 RepID=UPI0021659DEE|nr:uncharacterized protein LOC126736524 isoform X2 [Anthonomus grandis grandis]
MSDKAERVKSVLEQVANTLKIQNYEIITDNESKRGEGFLSECFTGKVQDKDADKVIEVYIKTPPIYHMPYEAAVYRNECEFYSNIFPEFDQFQKEKEVKEPIDHFARCFCTNYEKGEEYIALENLTVQNFILTDKAKPLDEQHLRAVCEIYGKWHALTFSYKDQNKEKYEELIKPIKNIYTYFANDSFFKWLKTLLEVAYNKIKRTDESRAEKIQKVMDNLPEYWNNAIEYTGRYSCFIHGDCWSNNFMFKYDDNNIEESKILDFQLIRDSTPVHDLSYFFYSGASKKDLDKLDEYLDLYYDTFSKFSRELGSDPEKLLPYEALLADWNTASLLGLLMSIILWQIKLVPREVIQKIGKNGKSGPKDGNTEIGGALGEIKNLDIYAENICDVLNHAIDRNII